MTVDVTLKHDSIAASALCNEHKIWTSALEHKEQNKPSTWFIDPDLDVLISPIKGSSWAEENQLLTIYQGVHITYFSSW